MELNELWAKQLFCSYLSQYLTNLDEQRLILKLTGRRIFTHTVPVSAHTHNPQGFLEISVIP